MTHRVDSYIEMTSRLERAGNRNAVRFMNTDGVCLCLTVNSVVFFSQRELACTEKVPTALVVFCTRNLWNVENDMNIHVILGMITLVWNA